MFPEVSADQGGPDPSVPYETRIPVLGVPVRFASNSEAVMREVEGHFGMWRQLPADLVGEDGADVRILVQDRTEGAQRPIPMHYHLPEAGRFILHTPGSVGVADAGRHSSIGYVSQELVEDRSALRFGVLNGLTLLLVIARDRHPVHAAVVGCGDAAVLLAGAPGVGKSTLAYQAHLHGLRVISDDSAYIQQHPRFRVWGLAGQVHLLAQDRQHFPDVGGAPGGAIGGRDKIAVDLSQDWSGGGLPIASRVAVCRLERGSGPARLARASREELIRFLDEGLGVHAAFHRASMDGALSRLCEGGGWRLALSRDPSDAVPYIHQMLSDLETKA